MLKKVGKPVRRAKKRTGIRLPGVVSFATVRLKDACYGPLTAQSQAKAAEYDALGNLDLLEGELRCECGKSVGAKRAVDGDYFQPDPRPHERYKEPPQPARKRDYGKRI
jgi:hypothetical protein